jgi:large subunit ribosomal protein L44e
MKFPRTMRTYCPRCKTHTEFNVSLYKAGKRRAAKQGERRFDAKQKGYGGMKRPIQHNQAKVTKKSSLMLECRECGYTMQRSGIRLKKAEVAQR